MRNKPCVLMASTEICCISMRTPKESCNYFLFGLLHDFSRALEMRWNRIEICRYDRGYWPRPEDTCKADVLTINPLQLKTSSCACFVMVKIILQVIDADGFNKPLVKNVCLGRAKSEVNIRLTVWDLTVVTWHAMYFFCIDYLMFSFTRLFQLVPQVGVCKVQPASRSLRRVASCRLLVSPPE